MIKCIVCKCDILPSKAIKLLEGCEDLPIMCKKCYKKIKEEFVASSFGELSVMRFLRQKGYIKESDR